MKVVYVAGPYRASSAWKIAENIRDAERAGLLVARLGAMPLIPHANTAHFQGELTDDFWLEGTLALLKKCDAIFMGIGWEHSSGSRSELEFAKSVGMPHFFTFDSLALWIAK